MLEERTSNSSNRDVFAARLGRVKSLNAGRPTIRRWPDMVVQLRQPCNNNSKMSIAGQDAGQTIQPLWIISYRLLLLLRHWWPFIFDDLIRSVSISLHIYSHTDFFDKKKRVFFLLFLFFLVCWSNSSCVQLEFIFRVVEKGAVIRRWPCLSPPPIPFGFHLYYISCPFNLCLMDVGANWCLAAFREVIVIHL